VAVGRSRMAAAALVLALAVACSCAPSAIAGERVVDAGALRAGVQSDPWGLTFSDKRGRTVLAEAPGTGTGEIGALGFRTDDGWFRATRVVSDSAPGSGDTYVADLETTDPAGRTISVVFDASRGGVITFAADVRGPALNEVTATGISFRAEGKERYLGFGERSNAVDQRGKVVENYVSDGPWKPDQYAIGEALLPEWGFRPRDDATYYPIPWLLSTDGYGVLVDNPETSYFRLDQGGTWSVEVVTAPPGEGAPASSPPPTHLQMRVFAGPEPADVLRRFTKATGRQDRAAAPWFFGPWVQPTGDVDEQVGILGQLQGADAPLSVAQTYLHYLPCGDQQGRRPEERARTAGVHDLGLAITTYFNPMICVDYNPPYGEAVARSGLTLDPADSPYVYVYNTTNAFDVSQFDFTQQSGDEVFGAILAEAIEDGHDGWMEDFGEYTPLDSHSVRGEPGTQVHNRYPHEYHCTAHEEALMADRPIVRFQRSGWTGTAGCASVVWGGDPSTVWDFDGLQSSVRQALTMGLSGISTWGSDIGGFFAIGSDALSPELLARWVQFGAVSGVMRTQAEGIAVPEKPRPQVWDPDQIDNWRRYTKLRTQLYPYIDAADAFYQRKGVPIMRHLVLRWPGDEQAVAREDEYLFGPDLLAAPVLEPETTGRELYLPGGRWVEFWDAIAYKQKTGDLELGKARLVRGKRSRTVSAKADELPLMVRAGALLPMLPADVDTLADRYADGGSAARGSGGGGQVSLADRKRRLDVLAFPRGRSASRAYGNVKLLSRERGASWRLKIKSKQRRRYKIDASLATLRNRFAPECVTVKGKPLSGKAWSYSKPKRLVQIKLRAKRTGIAVRARCKG
jgi:alpha-glucosidase (family GH31 glycosyl hydrolase)